MPYTRPKRHDTAGRAAQLRMFANIGVVTALEKEYAAVKAMLNRPVTYPVPGKGAGRRYCLGQVPSNHGGRHVVALCLTPVGNNAASVRATLLLEHFPAVE